MDGASDLIAIWLPRISHQLTLTLSLILPMLMCWCVSTMWLPCLSLLVYGDLSVGE